MSDQPIVKLVSDEEARDEAKEIFAAMIESTGGVPKWMRVMANCPDILGGFWPMFKSTMDDSPLDATLKWKVALLVSTLNECKYCVSVAEMKLKGFGLSESEIANLAHEDANDREKVALEYAEKATKEAFNINDELIQKVKSEFGDDELVELAGVIGLFNYINRFNDALNILPDLD